MAKPDDIPQDVWDAASEVVGTIDGLGYAKVHTDKIARAILAERERCAEIAETGAGWIGDYHRTPKASMTGAIAAAIRKGPTP